MVWVKVIVVIYGVCRGWGGLVFEWLKWFFKWYGLSILGEVIEKIVFLKGFGVDKWVFDGIVSVWFYVYG